VVKKKVSSVIEKEFNNQDEIEKEIYANCDKIEQLQAIISGEVEGDIEQAEAEMSKIEEMEEIEADISRFSIDTLFEEINYKRIISKQERLENGEIDVSSDECEPHSAQTGETQSDMLHNRNAFSGICPNCGQRGHSINRCSKRLHTLYSRFMQKFESRLKNNQNAVRRLDQLERERERNRRDPRNHHSRDQQPRRRDEKTTYKHGHQYEFDRPGERSSSYPRDRDNHHQNHRHEMLNRYDHRQPIQNSNYQPQEPFRPPISNHQPMGQPIIMNQHPMMVHQMQDSQQRIYGNPEVLQTMLPQHYSLQNAQIQHHQDPQVQHQQNPQNPHIQYPQNQQIYQQKYGFSSSEKLQYFCLKI
jgi:hypothetical protein